ncbi:MAG: hypothetical protein DCC68_11505 [Planctomycetota bacterium]|nr:MAG: hypothetical protein DCC68_11505 [Planctomycetota bacterium]
MRMRDARYTMERDPNLIPFDRLADLLGISQHELARLVATPEFPGRVHDDRRGYWRRQDVERYIAGTGPRQLQQQPRGKSAA